VAAWLLFVLPARRRRGQHAAMQESVAPGDEIITAGGLHGRVLEDGGETIRIEIAPGVAATLDRRAIAAVATEVEVEAEVEAEDEAEAEGQAEREAPEQDPAPENPAKPR
jgi:preprotein translocase subunit YajC